MTKSQIKAELRRNACSVRFPMFCNLSVQANEATEFFLGDFRRYGDWDNNGENKRIFFLLVAEAL